MRDTIYALSSGSLPSGVGVVRVSGSQVSEIIDFFGIRRGRTRSVWLSDVCDPVSGQVIDQGLVLYFEGPQSFTGEDVLELQLHGSAAVVQRVSSLLGTMAHVRLAEPGEFTLRAFENGKLDLIEVEAVADLIAAETENQRQLAMARLQGGLSTRVGAWRDALIALLAEIEADIDFSDESDVGALPDDLVERSLTPLIEEWESHLTGFAAGRLMREGVRVVLAGAPNVGKSSLLNALMRSDVAIVSDEPGTTRDVREVQLDLGGNLVVLIDVAGLREGQGHAEQEGVRRARQELGRADLILRMRSPDHPDNADIGEVHAQVIDITNKKDLGLNRDENGSALLVSAKTGDGLAELTALLEKHVSAMTSGSGGLLSRLRDRAALEQAVMFGREALVADDVEIVAELVRQIVLVLDRLIGKVDAEQMLDALFAGFCIGK